MLIDHAYREILRASGYEPPTPSEAELRAFFDEHAARYETVDEFKQITERLLEAGARAVA